MRLGTMTAIAVLLVSVTKGSEGSGGAALQERPHRRRHHRGNHHLRTLGGARQEQQEQQEQDRRWLPKEPFIATAAEGLALSPAAAAASVDLELEAGLRAARHRYENPAADFTVCCPSKEELTRPNAGTKLDGTMTLLDTSGGQQMFYERSCVERTESDDARVARHLRKRAVFRCVQEYSYSLAVFNVNGSQILDYMKIHSGCRCQLGQVDRRRKRRRRQRRRDARRRRGGRQRRRQPRRQSQPNASHAS